MVVARVPLAFFLLGLFGTFVYVVMLSAAKHIEGPDAHGGVGIILLCDVFPATLIKALAPFFLDSLPFPHRVLIIAVLASVSLHVVSNSESFAVGLLGVCVASLSFGLAEVSFLALASIYPRRHGALAGYSLGTGAAGLVGSGLYLFLTDVLGLGVRAGLKALEPLPVVVIAVYFGMLRNRAGDHQSQDVSGTELSSAHFSAPGDGSGPGDPVSIVVASEAASASTSSPQRLGGAASTDTLVSKPHSMAVASLIANAGSSKGSPGNNANASASASANSNANANANSIGASSLYTGSSAGGSQPASSAGGDAGVLPATHLTFGAKLRFMRSSLLHQFMLPFFFLYVSTYTINQGMAPSLDFAPLGAAMQGRTDGPTAAEAANRRLLGESAQVASTFSSSSISSSFSSSISSSISSSFSSFSGADSATEKGMSLVSTTEKSPAAGQAPPETRSESMNAGFASAKVSDYGPPPPPPPPSVVVASDFGKSSNGDDGGSNDGSIDGTDGGSEKNDRFGHVDHDQDAHERTGGHVHGGDGSYPLLYFCYSLGSLLGRASPRYLRVHSFGTLSMLQAANLFMIGFHASFVHLFRLWSACLMFTIVGATAGVAYAQLYQRVAQVTLPAYRPLAMGVCSLASSAGILIAGMLNVFIEEVVHGTHPLHPGTEDLTSFAWILGMGFALQEVWPRVRLTPERAQVENVEASRAEEALEVKENV